MANSDGLPVTLGRGMQRAVLGLLALHPNMTLSREAIIDALWGDNPPATAVSMIQSQVSKLRPANWPHARGKPTSLGSSGWRAGGTRVRFACAGENRSLTSMYCALIPHSPT